MIRGNRAIGLVAARAGSKGVPQKNIRTLGGRPLIDWTIACAKRTPELDRIVVSTDGAEIAAAAHALGAEVLERPAELATDDATALAVLRHAIRALRAEGESAPYLVLLQPTSPFRRPGDIRRTLELLHDHELDCALTMTEACLNPHRAFRLVDHTPIPAIAGAEFWRPRQDLLPAYEPNGAVYALTIDTLQPHHEGIPFGNAGVVLMDRVHSLDIDDEFDFVVAEALLAEELVRDR